MRVQKKNQYAERIAFKVVKIKSLALHINNQKKVFWYLQQKIDKISSWNMILIFCIQEKSIILAHAMYYWLLLQIHMCDKTGFVVQRHI